MNEDSPLGLWRCVGAARGMWWRCTGAAGGSARAAAVAPGADADRRAGACDGPDRQIAHRHVRQANGRKLQFGSGVCVLDAYLYARRNGQEPVVTYVDARQLDGSDIDRASCVASFGRR